MNRIFYLFVCLCFLSYNVWGQNTQNYSLKGQVQDTSGETVVGANIDHFLYRLSISGNPVETRRK